MNRAKTFEHLKTFWNEKNSVSIYRQAKPWPNGSMAYATGKCHFRLQNSTQLKYKYDIHNQHAKLHRNDMVLRISEKKIFFGSWGVPQGPKTSLRNGAKLSRRKHF